jgi:hypothetical protein
MVDRGVRQKTSDLPVFLTSLTSLTIKNENTYKMGMAGDGEPKMGVSRILDPHPWPLAGQCEIDRVATLKPRAQMNKQTVALIVLFAGLILTADMAGATTYEDIAGQWCGDVTDYVFTPDTLTVKFHDNRPANAFKITKYAYTDDSVRISWLNGADELVMAFAEFNGSHTAMAQQENEGKPRRAFHRC